MLQRAAGVWVVMLAMGAWGVASPGEEVRSWHLDCGDASVAAGAVALTPTTRFSTETGYGLEGDPAVTAWHDGTAEGDQADGLASSKPFLMSVAVPEGAYDVTVTLGNPAAPTAVTVKAEGRRLMLQDVRVPAGRFESRTFTVAVKGSTLESGKRIKRKPSQPEANWDGKLTLEFNGTDPSVASVTVTPAKDPVLVFIAGDSTVTDQDSAIFTGWGQMLPRFFKPGVAVWNNAQSGDTLGSFRGNGLLDQIWEKARPGDYLFVQFGHNDQKDKREGAGPFTSYTKNLEDYIEKARALKVNVVLVTSMERRRFDGDTPTPTLADFAEAVRQVGRTQDVPVIDLNAKSLALYAALGPEGSKKAFVFYAAGTAPDGRPEALSDNSHFDNYGGYELARIVATGVHDLVPGLRDRLAADYEPFDPSQPDPIESVVLPLSPVLPPKAKPEGS